MGCSGAYDSAMALMLASLHAAADLEDASTVTADAVRESMAAISDPDGEVIYATPKTSRRRSTSCRGRAPSATRERPARRTTTPPATRTPVLVHWTVEQQKFVESESYACSVDDPLCSIVE